MMVNTIQWPMMTLPPINLWTMPRMNSNSPCQNECLYDRRLGFCTSCGRSIQEVSNWTRFSNEMKDTINWKAKERLEMIKKDW